MTRPFDPSNRDERWVLTPDGIGELSDYDLAHPLEWFRVKVGKLDGRRRKQVRPCIWYRADELEEVEE
jgi:hypothetical protein